MRSDPALKRTDHPASEAFLTLKRQKVQALTCSGLGLTSATLCGFWALIRSRSLQRQGSFVGSGCPSQEAVTCAATRAPRDGLVEVKDALPSSGTAFHEPALRGWEADMRVSLASATPVSPKWLTSALIELCEREGLDPCQTACVMIQALAWMPRLLQGRKTLPDSAGFSRSEARMHNQTEMVRQRAYEIWQAEGKPDGRALEHWCRAEAEAARQ